MTRSTAAILVVTILAALLAAGSAAAVPSAAAEPLATVSIGSLDPTVGTPGSALRVTGTVQAGDQRLRDVQVSLRLSRTPVNSRSELSGVASGLTTSKDGDAIDAMSLPDGIPAAGSAIFDLGARLNSLGQLQAFGVYVLAVEVTATHLDGTGPVAITRTFLPWVPRQHDFQPTGFTWLWPLVSEPAQLSDGTFAGDATAGSLADGGRLSRLLNAGAQLGQTTPLTWAVDPDLLDSASAMSRGYTVRGAGDGFRGRGQQAASQWLDALRAATGSATVLSLPYADPDLSALRRGGLGDDIGTARTAGRETTAKVLQRDAATITDDVVWPPNGFVDRATLAVLRRDGANAVVLDGRAQPTRLELNYTPSGRAQVGSPAGPLDSLIADPGLTALLGRAGQSPLLAAQRFLAETALITAELPGAGPSRVVLVAPPRRWDPPPEFLDRVVGALPSAAWMAGTGLQQFRTTAPAEVEHRSLRYPKAARRAELPASYPTAVRSLHGGIATFGSMLADRANRDEIVPDLVNGLLRLESTWWRGRQDRANRLNLEQTHVSGLVKAVHVQPGSYTFGSKSGVIPLTIANDTDYDVVVDLQLRPQTPRLRLQPVDPVSIGPNRKVQVEVDASAVASGTVLVDATLRAQDGTELSSGPVQLSIRITQIGTVALVITVGAAAVLVLMALIRLARRARRARRAAARQDHDRPAPAPAEPRR